MNCRTRHDPSRLFKFVILFGLMVALLVTELCCTPYVLDSADFVIQPGLGIPGICEVGMTPRDLKRRNRDLKTVDYGVCWRQRLWSRWKYGRYFAVIPSLGAIAVIERRHVYSISFYFRSFHHPYLSGLRIDNPFQGRVKGRNQNISVGELYKEQIEAEFGVPEYRYYGIRSFEELMYFDKGINFSLSSNVIENIYVSAPKTVSVSGIPTL